ncbi:MAG TPA: cobaltochelatase subunit CobN [Methylomusa anaerophila]|uniref:Aerobic cobaltochelatase subunit CobN n=1 Tax=Methylomusa anaerophila TaxID=1930071 RepID=A0A348AE97_9FIRM|nr:cobaltochelatase subunit CobN [Methylomusa anaerophila]BBB89395.1 aerobic cobaltochelatase subunit CobN [Methylomusa anaerophila]HML90472.1 cobaltochelatase subunit CobN [Methylomusa anaerophila]
MKKITAVVWHSYATVMRKAGAALKDTLDIKVHSARFLEEGKEDIDKLYQEMEETDLLFFYRSSEEGVWSGIEAKLAALNKPVVWSGNDPTYWTMSNVPMSIPAKCYSYITQGGEENFNQIFLMLAKEALQLDVSYQEPAIFPWEGIYHPVAGKIFSTTKDYFSWYQTWRADFAARPTVGLLFSRSYWVNRNTAVEDMVINALEAKGFNVMAVFCYSVKDAGLGTRSPGESVRDYFMPAGKPVINALIKMIAFFLESGRQDVAQANQAVAGQGVALLTELGVPVFQPVVSNFKTVAEWIDDPHGLSTDIAWTIAMPEFEGVIEPLYIGGVKRDGGLETRMPVEERVHKLVDRISRWLRLQRKPAAERKVAFILNNNPCVSVEAAVGGGAHLDTLESVSRIMHAMKEAGYSVEPPASGKEMIETIMDRKAISEFRWTTVDEIVKKGGAVKLMDKEEYCRWFDTLTPAVRKRMIDAWGNPPGEEINGVPSAMVYQDKIVITGVEYGNAYVGVQPKRGCAGSRCDGQVCKILHDPDIPPPHQYMATYKYLEEQVDVVVHVGTHGNLEFLPGKGVALSQNCYPDLAIGAIPHLYIYNADNPPEGTIAKRRSCATLVDHMQTALIQGGLYDELAQLDQYLAEYEKAKIADPARAHTLEHMIFDEIEAANLAEQIKLDKDHDNFAAVAEKVHAILSTVRNTQIQDGQHIFGDLPAGERRIDFINSILRFDSGDGVSLRRAAAQLMDLDLAELLADQSKICPRYGKPHGALLEEIDGFCKAFLVHFVAGQTIAAELAGQIMQDRYVIPAALPGLNNLLPRVTDLNARIEASKEIESLLSGFDGKYIPAGPSGLITRGRDDVLPTGRNFYSLDPHRVPTKAAYEIGKRLADKVIEKHLAEEGRYPENIAVYWMCNDIMWADGEGMGQIMYLLGVRPKWLPNGRVAGIEVIPLPELGRPRIDVTIRVSGITRDNFANCVALLDEAVQAVAALDEPLDRNLVRKHTLDQLEGKEPGQIAAQEWRNATYRIFASKPGTYSAGVNLAVYASAWKEEKDLAEIFVFWNGYAYGKDTFGQESFRELQSSLKTVDVTYNKVVSDEYDLFGCCCYFSTHGGMTAAARAASGKDVKTYYGDTREPQHVEVRSLADEVRRVVRTKLLNPKWVEGQKRHGYKGAGDISKRVGRVFGWEATTQEVDDWIFDDIARTFMLDEENRRFFQENNPWAMEEIGRRLLEASQRGLWNADPEVLANLKETYLEAEGWLEENTGDVEGDFQGGAVDIMTTEDVADWGAKMNAVRAKLAAKNKE